MRKYDNMQASKILLIVFTSACMSCLALAEKHDTKDGKSKDGLRVSLGDRTAQVRSVYGEPDRVNEIGSHRKDKNPSGPREQWWYLQEGLSFLFTRNVLIRIDIGRKYRGSVEGIRIGDSRQVVRAKMGPPDDEKSDHVWAYYRGRWSQRISMHVQFGFGGDDKVTRIVFLTGYR